MIHQELVMQKEEISLILEKYLSEIIQSDNFDKTPSEIKNKILNLRDLMDRY